MKIESAEPAGGRPPTGADPPDRHARWPSTGVDPPDGHARRPSTGADLPDGRKVPPKRPRLFFGGGYAMAEVFRQQPRTIQRAMDNFRRRCEACVAAYGGAFEYFLD